MFNSTVLDVAIGLAFTYLLLALICTTISEWLAAMTQKRGKMLEKGLLSMFGAQTLNGQPFAALFQAHPLISGLRQAPSDPPSYIAPRTFSTAVMDLATSGILGTITFADLENGIKGLPDGPVKTSLLAVIQNAKGNLDEAQKGIEGWFNDAMDRVTGWYTRDKQKLSVILATLVTIFVNADSLNIANKLWVNPTLREEIVARAKSSEPEIQKLMSATYPNPADPKSPKVNAPDNTLVTVDKLEGQLGDLTGWKQEMRDRGNDLSALILNSWMHFPGWLLTIVAVSMGAPFWFDTLKRFMSVRDAGKAPAETKK